MFLGARVGEVEGRVVAVWGEEVVAVWSEGVVAVWSEEVVAVWSVEELVVVWAVEEVAVWDGGELEVRVKGLEVEVFVEVRVKGGDEVEDLLEGGEDFDRTGGCWPSSDVAGESV